MRVLQLSDIHFTAAGSTVDGRDPDARLATVLDRCARCAPRPDALVLSGDLTDDATRSACRRLREALEPWAVPILAVPGNHDTPAVVREHFETDALTVGTWRIVGLDTSRPAQIHGSIDVEAEMRRLDRWDGSPTVLVMHHPPLSPSSNAWFQLDGAQRLLTALASRPHVKLILSGHLHAPFESRAPCGPRVWGCPSTLIGFRHAGEEVVVGGSDATGARMIELADDGAFQSEVVHA